MQWEEMSGGNQLRVTGLDISDRLQRIGIN